jgi:hypothetical protein
MEKTTDAPLGELAAATKAKSGAAGARTFD